MDTTRATRRAASNVSLRSAYNSQPRLCSLSSAESRRNLRSVHENATLLPLPGPLESMLKTTTETGDIGAFSIRPITSSITFNHLPREHSACWDDKPRPRRRSESRETRRHAPPRVYGQDDRRRLPSYRGTASDIVSINGSEGQLAANSFLPPPFDDQGLRSYSMTSYGSKTYSQRPPERRHLAGTMPPFLQRPHSPFPYPTRLKRPGVRASSPALTENGNVDYSKMIGIDRVSHRTDHHRVLRPQPPPYCQGGRRGPPPSLRPDAARSMRSYSSYDSYCTQRTSSSTGPDYRGGRYHRPRPAHPWAMQPAEATNYGSQDVKPRYSSFGSIVDKYQYSSSTADRPPIAKAPPGLFYYDYSEDFDSDRQDYATLRTRSPLVPASARTVNSCRSSAMADSWRSRSRMNPAPSPSRFSTSQTDEGGGDDIEHSGNLVSEYIPVVPNSTPVKAEPLQPESHFHPDSVIELLSCESEQHLDSDLSSSPCKRKAGHHFSRHGLQQIDRGVPDVDSRESASNASRNEGGRRDLQADHTSNGHGSSAASSSATHDVDSNESFDNTASFAGVTRDRYRNSDTTISGHISSWLPSDHKMTHRSPGMVGCSQSAMPRYSKNSLSSTRRVWRTERTRDRRSTAFYDGSELDGGPDSMYNGSPGGRSTRDHQPSLGLHNRESHGVLRYNRVSGRVERDSVSAEISPARSETPLLAPKPISPAKELRVRNSIPQLMKALPALPGDHSPLETSNLELYREDSDDDGHSKVQILSISTLRSKKKEEAVDMVPETPMRQIEEEAETQPKVSKLKLRMSSPGSGSSRQADGNLQPGSPDSCEVVAPSSLDGSAVIITKSARCRKIKLKAPKHASTQETADKTETIKRNSIIATSSAILETQEGDSLDPVSPFGLGQEKTSPYDSGQQTVVVSKGHTRGRFNDTASLPPSPLRCTGEVQAFRGASLDINPVGLAISNPETIASLDCDAGISPSNASCGQKQGPRKRLSNIRLTITESLSCRTGREVSKQVSYSGGDQKEANHICRASLGVQTSQSDLSRSKPAVVSKTSRLRSKTRVRNKLSKLVKGARHAVKTYIRKRHRAPSLLGRPS